MAVIGADSTKLLVVVILYEGGNFEKSFLWNYKVVLLGAVSYLVSDRKSEAVYSYHIEAAVLYVEKLTCEHRLAFIE